MHVVWFKNDAKLHTSRTVLISSEGKTHKLEMREVTLDDISQIKAQVKDLSSTANLKVLGKHDQRGLGSQFGNSEGVVVEYFTTCDSSKL